MGITVDGVTFRWDEREGLIISTRTDRRVLSDESGAQLLDFLQSIQPQLYAAERSVVNGNIVSEELPKQIGSGRLLLPSREQST